MQNLRNLSIILANGINSNGAGLGSPAPVKDFYFYRIPGAWLLKDPKDGCTRADFLSDFDLDSGSLGKIDIQP